MKRALLENHKVLINPGIIDRQKFLSAVLALKAEGTVAEGTTVTIKFEHCDTKEGTFVSVTDSELCPSARIDDKTGTLSGLVVKADEDVNIDLDLIGFKQFIKITAEIDVNESKGTSDSENADTEGGSTGAALQTAIVLGDCSEVPV